MISVGSRYAVYSLFAFIATVLLLLTLAPNVYWLDSPEFSAAAYFVGIPHPPGHPFYLLTAKALTLIPIGDINFRVTLLSVLSSLLSLFLISGIIRRIQQKYSAFAYPSALAVAYFIALAFTFCYATWFQAVRAEVYGLHLGLILLLIYLFLRYYSDIRGHYLIVFLFGLSLGNHHYLTILAGIPFFFFFLGKFLKGDPGAQPRRINRLSMKLLLLFLGLAIYLYLPLIASKSPVINWGNPATAKHFLWTVSARAFQKSVQPNTFQLVQTNFPQIAGIIIDQLHPAGFILLLFGLWVGFRVNWKITAFLLGLAFFNGLSELIMPLDPVNPDAFGYLTLSVAVGFILLSFSVFGLGRLFRGRTSLFFLLMALLTGIYAVWQIERFYKKVDLSHFEATRRWSRALEKSIEPSGVLMTTFFKTIFVSWYYHHVENRRPDIQLIHLNFLYYPGVLADYSRRFPELSLFFKAFHRRDPKAFIKLSQITLRYYYEFEVNLLNYSLPQGVSRGLIFQISNESEVSAIEKQAFWQGFYLDLGNDIGELETRRSLIWAHYMHAIYYRQQKHLDLASLELEKALLINPGSPELRKLKRLIKQAGGR